MPIVKTWWTPRWKTGDVVVSRSCGHDWALLRKQLQFLLLVISSRGQSKYSRVWFNESYILSSFPQTSSWPKDLHPSNKMVWWGKRPELTWAWFHVLALLWSSQEQVSSESLCFYICRVGLPINYYLRLNTQLSFLFIPIPYQYFT